MPESMTFPESVTVIVSTPGHYFVVDGFDPRTGAYHVGQSGLAYRGGSEWMTPAQIEAMAGAPSGALFAEHPLAGPRQVLPPLDMGAVNAVRSAATVEPSHARALRQRFSRQGALTCAVETMASRGARAPRLAPVRVTC